MGKEKYVGEFIKLKSEDDITLNFPKLATPEKYENNSYTKLKKAPEKLIEGHYYGGEFVVVKGSKNHKKIKGAVDKVWKDFKLDKNKRAIYPITDGDELAETLEAKDKNGEHYRNTIVFKAKTLIKPKIYTKIKDKMWDCNESDDDNGISGLFVNLLIEARYYKSGATIGVNLRLHAVQLLEDNPDFQFGSNMDPGFDFEEKEPEVKEEPKDSNKKDVDVSDDKEESKNHDEIPDDDLPF